MRKKYISIPTEMIEVLTYARKPANFNEDWAFQLGVLLEQGTELEPITVRTHPDQQKALEGRYELVAGRHRLRAHTYAGKPKIRAFVDPNLKTESDVLVAALAEGVEGRQPTMKEDIIYAIQQLLQKGEKSRQQIISDLSQLYPREIVIQYVADAQSNLAKQRERRALDAIASGAMNVPDAATRYNVDQKILSSAISQKRTIGKGKKGRIKNGIAEIKGGLGLQYKRNDRFILKQLDEMITRWDDADADDQEVLEIFSYVEVHVERSKEKILDKKKRFMTMRQDEEKEVSGKVVGLNEGK